jgi:hypothetical protein
VTTRRVIGLSALAAYVGVIWLANWALTRWGVVSVGFGLVAPAGVYFAGLALGLRDVLQDSLGRLAVVVAILLGAAVSYWLGANTEIPGGHVSIAVASGCAFLLSEAADFAVYTPIRERAWLGAVTASNIVGAVVDSLLFLTLAFGTVELWKGQVVGKLWVTALFVAALYVLRLAWPRAEAVV